MEPSEERRHAPCAFVFAPDPLLTVTIEAASEGDEIHLHAGGQGYWVARMISALGVPVSLCGPFGGEAGHVARSIIEKEEGVLLQVIETKGGNGAYVHDRRGGDRVSRSAGAAGPGPGPEPLGRRRPPFAGSAARQLLRPPLDPSLPGSPAADTTGLL